MIAVDMGELKNECRSLSVFLKSKIQVSTTVKDKVLVLDSNEKMVSPRNVKTCVKRFLYHRGLSETYRVTKEHRVVRITKRKSKVRRVEKKGIPPLPYDTLPYYFPAHP